MYKVTQTKDLNRWINYVQDKNGTVLFAVATITKNRGLYKCQRFLFEMGVTL